MLVKMSRLVFIINAIIGSRFVSITTVIIKTLCKQIYIVIIIITIRTIKAETGEEKERRAERHLPGHEKERTTSELSWVQYPLLYNMPRGSPDVANLSNTIKIGIQYTEFLNWPSL